MPWWSSSDKNRIPRGQSQLRHACATGDIKRVKRLLNPPDWSYFWSCILWFWCGTQAPVLLTYVYVDDDAKQPIHYIASGLLPWQCKQLSARESAQQAEGSWDDTIATSVAGFHSTQRAKLLVWILDQGLDPDLKAKDMRSQTPLHWAAKSRSVPVMEALLEQGRQRGLQADWVCEISVVGHTALDIALASQQWAAVRTLLAAGALQDSEALRTAQRHLAECLPQRDRSAAPPRPAAACSSSSRSSSSRLLEQQPSLLSRSLGLLAHALGVDVHRIVGSLPGLGDGPRHGSPRGGCGSAGAASSSSVACGPLPQISTTVLNSQMEVAEHWEAAVARVAQVCGIDQQAAETLLSQHQYSIDTAIKAYMQDPSCAPAAAPGAPACGERDTSNSSTAATEPAAQASCLVCFEPLRDASVQLRCGHSTCDACWLGVLRSAIEAGNIATARCPEPSCRMMLPQKECKKLLPPAEWLRFQQLATNKYVDVNPHVQWCPRPGCGRSVSTEAVPVARLGKAADPEQLEDTPCPEAEEAAPRVKALLASGYGLEVECSCGHRFCWACRQPPHEPATCAMMRRWEAMIEKEREQHEVQSQLLLDRETRQCPNCHTRIQRSAGCNHMRCVVCGQHFCWACGEDWALHGPSTGGFYWCTRNPQQQPQLQSRQGLASLMSCISHLGSVASQVLHKVQKIWLSDHYRELYNRNNQGFREEAVVVWHILRLLRLGLPAGNKFPGSSLPPKAGSGSGCGSCAAAPGAGGPGPWMARLAGAKPAAVPGGPPLELAYLPELLCLLDRGRELLRHAYVRAYFLDRGRGRRYLEHLTQRLSTIIEQLHSVLVDFPHHSAIPPTAGACGGADAATAAAVDGWGGLVTWVRSVTMRSDSAADADGARRFPNCGLDDELQGNGYVDEQQEEAAHQAQSFLAAAWYRLCYMAEAASEAILLTADRRSRAVRVPGHQLRDQFYAALALHQHRSSIRALLNDAALIRVDLLNAARSGLV